MALSDRYPPEREVDLITAATTFHDVANVAPTTYSLTAAMLTSLAAKLADFQTKWDTCQVPGTRTSVAIQQKDASRIDLVSYLRSLTRVVQNAVTTDNAMRAALAIPLRFSGGASIPIPGSAPGLHVVKVYGHQITCRLESQVSEGRGLPPGVLGAQIYTLISPTPSSDTSIYVPQGLVTRTSFAIEFPSDTPAGSKVWITAQWVNPRGQAGLACTPVPSGIGYEGAEPISA
jgi:hypothetical protein